MIHPVSALSRVVAFACLYATAMLPPLAAADAAGFQSPRQSEEVRSLAPGAPIGREISGGQRHSYRISLSAGQFALVQVEQRGAEVVLGANGPDGREFAAVDLRIGGMGVEPLAIVADTAGEYILNVISKNPKAPAATVGRYTVKIGEARAATEQDRMHARAQSLCYEAGKLSLEKSPDTKRKAVQLYAEALPLWPRVPEPLWEAASLYRLGRLHIELTEFSQAKDYFSRSVIARRSAGDRRGEVSAQNGVCEALHYLGDTKGKAECLNALIPIYRELGERLEEAKVRSNIATTFRELGDYQAALQAARQALGVFQAEGDRVQESFALNTLGQIYWALNERQLALDHYERALLIRREVGDRRRMGLTLGDIGVIYFDLGDLPRALDYFNQAMAISEEFGDRRTKAIYLQKLGEMWKRAGDPVKALDALTQSLALARAVGDRRAEGQTLIAISDLYLFQGEQEKARDSVTQALELARATGDPVSEAAALRRLGSLAATAGDRQQGIDLLQQSLSLARATNDLQGTRDALIALAETERERNNLGEARDHFEKAIELTESLRAKILHQELRASYLASRQGEYALYADLLMQLHQQQPSAGYAAAAFEVSERARARSLLEILAESRPDIRQGVDAALLAEERTLADRIRVKEQQRAQAIGSPQAAKQTEALAKEIGDLLNEYQSLQGRIRAASPRYAALMQPRPLSAAQVQELLDENTVLLEFSLGETQSWLWAVTRDSLAAHKLPPRAAIEAAARNLHELLGARQPKPGLGETEQRKRIAGADANLPVESAALSRMLLGPIAAELGREWKGKRLAVVAAGALEYVPFAALPVPMRELHPQSPQLLIADHEVVHLPSASALAVIRREASDRRPAAMTLAVLADPVFEASDPRLVMAKKKRAPADDLSVNVRSAVPATPASSLPAELVRSARSFHREGFGRLVFSREEADAIAGFAPRNSLLKATGFAANRQLAAGGELSRYRIVHFATHGLINSEHPELSGLVLSLVDESGRPRDGFLRMHELFNLQMPADLVVLSACQTALGKEIRGEGLVGLTRGFMYAGAARVVASLWQVDDQATAQLMQAFYRGMLKENLRPAAALRAAQIELSKQKRWAAPYYWAGFVMQGEYK